MGSRGGGGGGFPRGSQILLSEVDAFWGCVKFSLYQTLHFVQKMGKSQCRRHQSLSPAAGMEPTLTRADSSAETARPQPPPVVILATLHIDLS